MTTWRDRVWQEFRADNLTRGYRDVLLTLATFRGHGGLTIPWHETLASRAGCCTRTVQRALAAARELGLVTWCERRVRAGWRWPRTSNAYRLGVPAKGVDPELRRVWPRRSTTGQNARGGESLKKEGSEKAANQGRKAAWEELRRAAAGHSIVLRLEFYQ